MAKLEFLTNPAFSEALLTPTDIYEGLSDEEIIFVHEAIGVIINKVKQAAKIKFPFIYDSLIAEYPTFQLYLATNKALPEGVRDTDIYPQFYPLFFDNKYKVVLQNLLQDLGWLDGEKPFFASHKGSENRREVLLLFKEADLEGKFVRDDAFSASLDDILQHIQVLLSENGDSTLLTSVLIQIQTLKQRATEYTSGLQISELQRIRHFITRYANQSLAHSPNNLAGKTIALIDRAILANRIVQHVL